MGAEPKPINPAFLDDDAIMSSLHDSFQDAVRDHRRHRVPMVFWDENAQSVVHKDPFEIPLPEDDATRKSA